MEDFHTSLYYAFSTIAQSLAALVGLLSAVALFRLESIASDLRGRANSFAGKIGSYPLLECAIADERYADFLAKVDELVETGAVTFTPQENASLLRMKQLVALQPQILDSFKLALGCTAGIIAGSVAVVAFAHKLDQHEAEVATWFLGGGILLVLLALALYANLMRTLLR